MIHATAEYCLECNEVKASRTEVECSVVRRVCSGCGRLFEVMGTVRERRPPSDLVPASPEFVHSWASQMHAMIESL